MKLADLLQKFGLVAKEEATQVDLKDTEELKELLAAFEGKEAELSGAIEEVANLKAELAQFAEAKEAAEKAAAEAVAKAHQDKMDMRMSQLSAEFGDEKAAKLLKIAANMDDAEYAEVFGVQRELAAKEEETFAEQGIEGQVQAEKKPVHFKTFIKKQGK